MTTELTQFVTVGSGAALRRIATLIERDGRTGQPGLMWLPGFKSEMTSTKASDLAAFARDNGLPMTRLDYSGHGQSGGDFDAGTISRWLEETRTVFEHQTTGPHVVIGSSMGGYLALLLLRALMREALEHADRIKALILIAPAWDMTETLMWRRFPDSVKNELAETGVYLRPSGYGDGPYRITQKLIDDGRKNLIGNSPFDPGRPVHILHGLDDPDVPWEHTLDLDAHLSGNWTTVSAVPDGDHRLSRPEDLVLLRRIVARFMI